MDGIRTFGLVDQMRAVDASRLGDFASVPVSHAPSDLAWPRSRPTRNVRANAPREQLLQAQYERECPPEQQPFGAAPSGHVPGSRRFNSVTATPR